MKASLLQTLLFLVLFLFASAEPSGTDQVRQGSSTTCKNPFCQSGHGKPGQSCEPLPPDVLDVVTVKDEDGGDLTIDVTVRSNASASVQLVTPASPRLKPIGGNVGMAPKALAKGDTREQKLKLRYSDKQLSENLVFRALLKNDKGEVWADISETVEINPELSPSDPSLEKVAVVVNSGGRRLVQYMTRSEAAERGLKPAAPQAKPVADEPETEDQADQADQAEEE